MTAQDRRCGTCRWFCPAYQSKGISMEWYGPWCDWPDYNVLPSAMPDEPWITRKDAGTTYPTWEALDANPG